MLWPLLATALIASPGLTDPIAAAQQQFEHLDSYRVTVRSSTPHTRQQIVRYAYRKPGFVRMEFLTPHPGALMIYNPHSDKVRVWPFGQPGFALTLAPDNPLIRGPHGHRIDRSHVGMLLQAVHILQTGGDTTSLGSTTIGRWPVQGWGITGAHGNTVAGVHRFQLWLTQGTSFPVKVVSFGLDGELQETVLMDDVELDVPLSADFFQP